MNDSPDRADQRGPTQGRDEPSGKTAAPPPNAKDAHSASAEGMASPLILIVLILAALALAYFSLSRFSESPLATGGAEVPAAATSAPEPAAVPAPNSDGQAGIVATTPDDSRLPVSPHAAPLTDAPSTDAQQPPPSR